MDLDSPIVTNTAGWLAAHALPAFGVALALLLLCVAGVWKLAQRYGVRSAESRFSPLRYLLAYLLMGFVLVTSAATVFAEIAENLGDGRKLGQLDLLVSDTIRATVSVPTLKVFAVLTHLGDPLTLVVLCGAGALVLFWRKHFAFCTAWVMAIGGNAVLNRVLKSIFERTRPVHEHGLASASGFSFPSGHSSGSVVAYGMLAYLLARLLPGPWSAARLPMLLAATAIAYTVGSSRVFLQVHFASDVLAGFASGTAWLAVCIGAVELALYRQGRRIGVMR
jgi:membrane-associated phospholipid phosphatase